MVIAAFLSKVELETRCAKPARVAHDVWLASCRFKGRPTRRARVGRLDARPAPLASRCGEAVSDARLRRRFAPLDRRVCDPMYVGRSAHAAPVPADASQGGARVHSSPPWTCAAPSRPRGKGGRPRRGSAQGARPVGRSGGPCGQAVQNLCRIWVQDIGLATEPPA
jgi:hypothetical protein